MSLSGIKGGKRTSVEDDASLWASSSTMKGHTHEEIGFASPSSPYGGFLRNPPHIKPGTSTGVSTWISFGAFANAEEGNARLRWWPGTQRKCATLRWPNRRKGHGDGSCFQECFDVSHYR